MAQRAVGVEDEVVVAETRRGDRERFPRREHDAPLENGAIIQLEVTAQVGRAAPLRGLVSRVGKEDHVAGFLDRLHERLVRFGARPIGAAEFDPAFARVRAGKIDVVADHLRGREREVIDHHRMHHARPRPSSDIWLEVSQRVLVDLDERDVLAGRLGMGRARETPIVRLQLDRLQRVWADSAAHDGEQSIRGEDDAGGDQADEDTGQELTHD